MMWESWIIVLFFLLCMFVAPGAIGKPREPMTQSQCIIDQVVSIIIILLAMRLGGAF